MKLQKYFLVSAVFTIILCVPLLGEVEPDLPNGTLLGQPNPALAGIDKLYVWIIPHDFEPNSYGLVIEALESSIIDKIEKANITTVETDINKMEPNSMPAKMANILRRKIEPANAKNLKYRYARIPELRVVIDMLDIEDSQQVIFRIQTSLARLVHLDKESGLAFKTNVWQSKPIMRSASTESIPIAVTSVILEQAEEFIHAYLAANPPGKQVFDKTDTSTVPQARPKPAVKSAPVEHKYVTSKNSNVFHSPDCSSAKRIKPENLVNYSSRNDAINAGKRPCKRCKP